MAFNHIDLIGGQAFATTETTQSHQLGMVVRGFDSTFGVGEFIYLKGVASTAVGSIVSYNTSTFTTVLCPVGNNRSRPVAFAMSANVANQFGWYQIGGVAVARKTCTICLVTSGVVGVLTIGLVAGSGSGKELRGAIVAATASAAAGRTTVQLTVNRPHMQGRVT